MSFFSKKKESECLLAFDIGSGSVGGAIVITTSGRIPTILYSFRSDILFQEEATSGRLSSLMLRSLSQAVLALSQEGFEIAGFGAKRPRIDKILVSLSAPWVVQTTSFLQLKNKEPTLITEKLFTALLEQSGSESDTSKRPIPRGSVKIEERLIKSVLNGYETPAPYGMEALEAEFAMFSSFSLPKVIEGITETITHLFHVDRVSFHAFALIAYRALRKMYPEEANFIFVDVSGEQTEISLSSKGVIVETVTFPFGKNHIIRFLKKEANIPPSTAESFFRFYREKSGAGKVLERIEKLLEQAKEDWRSGFAKTLATLSEEVLFPKSLFIIADDSVLSLFVHALEGQDFSQFAISTKTFHIMPLTAELLSSIVKWNTSEHVDPFLGMIASFANESL